MLTNPGMERYRILTMAFANTNLNLYRHNLSVESRRLLTPQVSQGKLCFRMLNLGVDMVEVQRIRKALEDARIGKRFRERVFTAREIQYCESKRRGRYESYAGRFAAKEAVMKALGRGWGAKVCWLDIEVARARSGKPEIVLHDKTARLAEQLGIRRWSLSITHTGDHGLAYVIGEDR